MVSLARLAAPYKGRAALALGALLAATITALIPPYLSKLAIDNGISQDNLVALGWIVAAFVVVALLNWGASSAQTYFTAGRASECSPTCATASSATCNGCSLGYYERNRAGVIISRLTNDVDALDQLVTEGVTSLLKNALLLLGSMAILFTLDWR